MAENDGNGRITLAILGEKLDTIIKRLDKYDARCEVHEQRMNALETGAGVRAEQIATLKDEVSTLRNKSDGWNLGNSILAFIAGIMAWVK